VQQDGDLVGAERRGEPGDPADAGRRPDLHLASVEAGAGLDDRGAVGGGVAQGALVAAVDLEPLVEGAAPERHVHGRQGEHRQPGEQHDPHGQDGDEEPAHHAEERAQDDERDLAGLAVAADDRVRPGAADQICAAGRDRMGHVGLGGQRPSPPVRLVLLLRVLPACGVLTGLAARGAGAAEGTDPPPFAGRELWAATPPEAGLDGRGPEDWPPPASWPARVLWVLMPWATRVAGELMTAAALPSAPCMMRLLREPAMSSPKPGTKR